MNEVHCIGGGAVWILFVAFFVLIVCGGCSRKCPPTVLPGSFPERCYGDAANSHVVAIIPGLNNSGESFNELTAILCSWGVSPHVVDVELASDEAITAELWQERVQSGIDKAKATNPTAKLSLIGYSLGANLALNYVEKTPGAVSNLVLIAPAISLPFRARALLALGSLSPFNFKVPSLAPCGYRVRDYTEVSSYHALSKVRAQACEFVTEGESSLPPTTIFVRESDSLVSYRGTVAWASRFGSTVEIVRVSSDGEPSLDPHLLVDKRSFGDAGWDVFLSRLKKM